MTCNLQKQSAASIILLLVIHFLHLVVDVSAQSCTITPLNPTTLTATGGGLPGGTMNVRIRCSCTESDGMAVDVVRWYDPAGIRLMSARNTEQFNGDVPHFTRVGGDLGDNIDNSNNILVIPTFTDSYDGRYTCGRDAANHTAALIGPNANVTLTIDSELMINTITYLYVAMYILARSQTNSVFVCKQFMLLIKYFVFIIIRVGQYYDIIIYWDIKVSR